MASLFLFSISGCEAWAKVREAGHELPKKEENKAPAGLRVKTGIPAVDALFGGWRGW